ncbi:hypothetical protein CDEST_12793 [Colletotrichum destructivum]|uniref:Uncharacterized protein n=1 Tax=Colletotrichum destructivum TaxID=34406 RepID=A0AAX4IWV8_9PEZI|nr:hypothetical protein CDEST_12793 [Colletotrichum destructivum]
MDSRRSSRPSNLSSGQPRHPKSSGRFGERSHCVTTSGNERQREVPQGRSGYNRTRDQGVSPKGRSGYN